MISLDYRNQKLQDILRKELSLGKEARFSSHDLLEGTQLFRHAFGMLTDGDITWVLIRGTFVATDVYVLMKTDLTEEFRFPQIAKELEEKELDPVKTRLLCVAVNDPGKVPGAQKLPDIQIFRIPF